jgi:hypothetical protein
MSSPKTAAAKTMAKTLAKPVAKATPKAARRRAALKAAPPPAVARNSGNGVVDAAQAKRFAADIERALASGQRDVLSADALQALMAAVCRAYAAQIEAGEQLLPLPAKGGATATDVMVTASGLLKAANLAVFELGMWQSWTGR